MIRILIGALSLLGLFGCVSHAVTTDDFAGTATERNALVADITKERMAIEARKAQLDRLTVPTDKLEERIKQKWSKLEFYSRNGQVQRIKSYPHDGISTRTEEFYFRDGQLIFAYIQDNGVHSEAGGQHTTGKEYYYDEGRFVAERNLSGEKEYSIRHSDEERLEAEAMEYVDIFESYRKS